MALVVKNPPANVGDIRDTGSIPGLGRSPEGGHGNHARITPVFLSGKSHGQMSLMLQSMGCKESDMTERLANSFFISLHCRLDRQSR